MANQLSMADIHSIQLLHSMHWSQRRIARELGIDRETGAEVPGVRVVRPKTRHFALRLGGFKTSHFFGVPGSGRGRIRWCGL